MDTSRSGSPERHPDAFNLTQRISGESRTATCQVWAHTAGWELRLYLTGYGLMTKAVVSTVTEIMETSAEWSQALRTLGWQD